MNRLIRAWVIVFALLVAPAGAYAKVNLEANHGKDLTKADFVVRYKFQKTTGIDWKQSTLAQRKTFLEKWYADLDKDKKLAAAKAKKEKEIEKVAAAEKKEDKQKEKDRLKRLKAIEKRVRDEEKARDKEFKETVDERDKQLKELRRQQEANKHM